MFFGSALTAFGVQTFLETYLKFAPSHSREEIQMVKLIRTSEDFSGFIFKIQANMNPKHRDRIAFVRICSGKFERGMTVNFPEQESILNLTQSTQFLADDRKTVNEAVSWRYYWVI